MMKDDSASLENNLHRSRIAALEQLLEVYEKSVLDSTEKLRESEERFRSAFENAVIGMALVALDGRWLKVNHSLCEMTGYPEHELLNKTFQKTAHPDDREPDLALMRKLLSRETAFSHLENRFIHRDGRTIWVMLSISMVDDAQGNPLYFVGQIENITQRKQAEEELIQLNEHLRQLNESLEERVREKTGELLDAQEKLVRNEKLAVLGRLSGLVGHELRNPLGIMKNAVCFLKIVLEEGDDTVKEYLEIIEQEIGDSQRIIDDLLGFSRTRPPQAKTITARKLVDESLGKCVIPENVELHTDLPYTLPALKVDPLQMMQVLQNLIQNAVQAMPEGGTLHVGAKESPKKRGEGQGTGMVEFQESVPPLKLCDEFVEISVADTGAGIASENMKKLFQPLFTTKPRGIGLGLVVCKNLTEANRGGIEVESEPGKGTLFTVRLPAG